LWLLGTTELILWARHSYLDEIPASVFTGVRPMKIGAALLVVLLFCIATTTFADELRWPEQFGNTSLCLGVPPPITGVIVIESPDEDVQFLRLKGNELLLDVVTERINGKIAVVRSPPGERAKLIESWAKTARSAQLERRAGPPIRVLSPALRYPLPTDIVYIGNSPDVIEGPFVRWFRA
jgi:hypothetical protein